MSPTYAAACTSHQHVCSPVLAMHATWCRIWDMPFSMQAPPTPPHWISPLCLLWDLCPKAWLKHEPCRRDVQWNVLQHVHVHVIEASRTLFARHVSAWSRDIHACNTACYFPAVVPAGESSAAGCTDFCCKENGSNTVSMTCIVDVSQAFSPAIKIDAVLPIPLSCTSTDHLNTACQVS